MTYICHIDPVVVPCVGKRTGFAHVREAVSGSEDGVKLSKSCLRLDNLCLCDDQMGQNLR